MALRDQADDGESQVATDAQTDVGSDSTPFACGGSDIIVCEDFETDLSRWNALAADGQLTLGTSEDRAGQVLQVSHAGGSITMLQYSLPEPFRPAT